MKKTSGLAAALLAAVLGTPGLGAQAIRDGAVQAGPPLKRIAIFSSGLAYYEHTGTVNGSARFSLPFRTDAMNDALKSLVLNDPASAHPQVHYQSEQTLVKTLRSLSIDLSGDQALADILSGLRGVAVELATPLPISGRIVGVEYRRAGSPMAGEIDEPWLSLHTAQGLRLVNLKEIGALSFTDPVLNRDLDRALDALAASRNADVRDLVVTLPGSGTRQVSISYVIPAPVWKASYRLDLGSGGGTPPLFQGWAIVDNDGDADWNGVELSLLAGRPASFIQNLYPPYYLSRPVLPLAIAGAAAAESHGTAYTVPAPASPPRLARAGSAPMEPMEKQIQAEDSYAAYKYEPPPAVTGGAIRGAAGVDAGNQFAFTIPTPVHLDRGMSAMLPLVEAAIEGRTVLILSDTHASGGSVHPRLGAEITNTTGMPLPAGPITVYDGGVYAGDALIEFWNENEKRLISFGEDLSVSAAVMSAASRSVSAVTVAGGVMTISRSQDYVKNYVFKNSSAEEKRLVLEHTKTQGAELASPKADGQTPAVYRFSLALPAGRETAFTVKESRPVFERVSLLQLRPETFVSYAGSQEIPGRVRAVLQRAIELRRAAAAAEEAAAEAEKRRAMLVAEQERIRKNLEAAGSQTQQGQEYLKRLSALDADIDRLTVEIETLHSNARAAQKAYEDYLNGIELLSGE